MKEANIGSYPALEAYFEKRVLGLTAAAGRFPIVWQVSSWHQAEADDLSRTSGACCKTPDVKSPKVWLTCTARHVTCQAQGIGFLAMKDTLSGQIGHADSDSRVQNGFQGQEEGFRVM